MSPLPGRRRPAHRISRRRRFPPIAIVAVAVVLVGLSFPVARAITDRSSPRGSADATKTGPQSTAGSSSSTNASTTESSAPEAAPRTTSQPTSTLEPTAPGIRIEVVPALRDVQIRVGRIVYSTDPTGRVDLPDARGKVAVGYVGYDVTPPLQQVIFRSWSDGSTARTRTLDASGRGQISVAVDLRYHVTAVQDAGGEPVVPGALTATSSVGDTTFDSGTPRWVLAERGELTDSGVVARRITYTFGSSATAPFRVQRFTAGPEDTWIVHTDRPKGA